MTIALSLRSSKFRIAFSLVLMSIGLLVSCDDPFGGSSDPETGTAPSVIDAYFVEEDDATRSRISTLEIGSAYYAVIVVSDPDLDASSIEVVESYPDGSTSTSSVELIGQTEPTDTFVTGSAVAIGPTGQYQLSISPVDGRGNRGTPFSVAYSIVPGDPEIAVGYAASSSSYSGSFTISYQIENTGGTSLSMTSASFGILGSGGGLLPDITVTSDTLEYPSLDIGEASSSYTLSGYSSAYVPYQFGFTFEFSTGDGSTYEWSGLGDFSVQSYSETTAPSERAVTVTRMQKNMESTAMFSLSQMEPFTASLGE
jgi:hypothetical protein